MKKLFLGIAAVFILTAAILFTVFLLDGGKTPPADASAEASVFSAPEGESLPTPTSDESKKTGELIKSCERLIESGIYKLTVTRQAQIGGLSVPITTVTCCGDGFVSIVEYEGHDIMSEVFINGDGAYYLNADIGTAFLFPADTVKTDSFYFKDLLYVESGSTNAGTSAYEYERYITPTGQTVDYLFAGGALEKLKLYDGEEYELISVNLSPDIGTARSELPKGIEIVDNR